MATHQEQNDSRIPRVVRQIAEQECSRFGGYFSSREEVVRFARTQGYASMVSGSFIPAHPIERGPKGEVVSLPNLRGEYFRTRWAHGRKSDIPWLKIVIYPAKRK